MAFGNNSVIKIGEDNLLDSTTLWLEDTGSRIELGNHNRFTGKCQLSAIEGCRVKFGDNNLISSEIYISTGDSHSIMDNDSKQRINPSADINIGNHVWIGHRAVILKGVNVANDVIIGESAVLTRSVIESHTAVAGIPAKTVKSNITWNIERK